MKPYRFVLPLALALATPAMATDVAVPHTFSAGDPARAAEVNANFAALVAEIKALKAEIKALKESPVQQLAGFVEVHENPALMPLDTGTQGPLIRFTGANVQIVSGSGETRAPANGLGNLIVGYDEDRDSSFGSADCSNGKYHADQAACEAAGERWQLSHKSGSHNLVVGTGHNYSRHSGLVTGYRNSITGDMASVIAGHSNTAAGASSSVTGGQQNRALGTSSSVSGGNSNQASGSTSSVSGGWENGATGLNSSISGGRKNKATAESSSVLGGFEKNAVDFAETIPRL